MRQDKTQVDNNVRHIFILIAVVATIISCDTVDKKVCGDPQGQQKKFIDSLNKQHGGQISFEQVPCYPGYLQAHLKVDVPQDLLDSINVVRRQNQWVEFLVYDKKGKLVMGTTGSM
jgi:hypothetical protein